jgi:hypothetical protein
LALNNVNPINEITEKQKKDHVALISIWEKYERSNIRIITCEDDCLMEFANYDSSINSYSEIESYLSSNPKMLSRFNLFKKVEKGKLKICPFGEYGFGSGPFGGGPKINYDLLHKIKYMLNIASNSTPQRDRDARHIMHSILYSSVYFVTMDYKLIRNFEERHTLIKKFLSENRLSIDIISPSKLIENLI